MDHDYLTIALAVISCAGVFTGYWIIAWRWSQAARNAPQSEGKKALHDLKWIFIFCGICGYLWIILEMFWPAWRLYIFFLFALNIYTWRYVLRMQGLEEVYQYLRDRDRLVKQLESQEIEISRLKKFEHDAL